MAELWKPVAAVACCALLLGQCSKDPITGAKAAVGGAAVGAGVGVGIAAGGAAGGAAAGIKRGASKRAEDVISGRSNRPKPAPQPPVTTTRPVPVTTTTVEIVGQIRDCVNAQFGICVVRP